MHLYFFYLLLACQGIAAVTSILSSVRLREHYMRLFSFYLVFILLSELTGLSLQTLRYDFMDKEFYNYIVIPAEYLFFYWLFSTQTIQKRNKIGIALLSISYVALLLFEYLHKSKAAFLSISYMFGSLFLLIIVFNYLYNYIKEGDIIHFKKNPFIFISIGLIIFYIGTFPFYGIKNYLWTHYRIIGNNYWFVATTLNCVMYCMFTLSFLCNNKQKSI